MCMIAGSALPNPEWSIKKTSSGLRCRLSHQGSTVRPVSPYPGSKEAESLFHSLVNTGIQYCKELPYVTHLAKSTQTGRPQVADNLIAKGDVTEKKGSDLVSCVWRAG